MAADSGYIRIYDETNSLIYKRTAYSGGYASTAKLEGNILSFSVELANTVVYVSSYSEPEINTKNIVVESSPEGDYTSTIITLPVAPNKVKLATGTEQIDEYSGYIELLQGQTKTTAYGAGFNTGAGAVIYYEGGGTMSKSYDLSTSSKWSALSDGEHTVQIVAKGTGYRDSERSSAVVITKATTPISFTIDGTSYQAEDGMTWAQWVDSSYNTSNGKYYIGNGYLKWRNGNAIGSVYGPTATSSNTNPKGTDTPQANGVYTKSASGGGAD